MSTYATSVVEAVREATSAVVEAANTVRDVALLYRERLDPTQGTCGHCVGLRKLGNGRWAACVGVGDTSAFVEVNPPQCEGKH